MDFINRLREKPDHIKSMIAFTTSGVITLMIFGVWVSQLNFSGQNKIIAKVDNTDLSASVQNTSQDVNPVTGFWSVLSKGWNGFMNRVNQKPVIDPQTDTINDTINFSTTSEPEQTVILTPEKQDDVFILTQ